MAKLPDEIEQQLRGMTSDEWDALTARLRAPDDAEAFRESASRFISGDRLDAVCAITTPSLYLGEDGSIDAAKVERQLRALFDDLPRAQSQARWQNFGQSAAPPPEPAPGDLGNAEARKRFHGAQVPTDSAGSREAAKRFGGQS